MTNYSNEELKLMSKKYLEGTLEQEKCNWIEARLSEEGEFNDFFMNVVQETAERKELDLSHIPSTSFPEGKIDVMLMHSSKIQKPTWQKYVEMANSGVVWAQEEIEHMREDVNRVINRWRLRARRGSSLGALEAVPVMRGATEQNETSIKIILIDETGNRQSELAGQWDEWPQITSQGQLVGKFHFENHFELAGLVCEMSIRFSEDTSLVFETHLVHDSDHVTANFLVNEFCNPGQEIDLPDVEIEASILVKSE